jgi:4-hydroxy-3-methylbut-2-enyl diphosphate reductase
VLVQAVIDRLKDLGAASVRALEGVEEHVTFPLPKGLDGVRPVAFKVEG